MPSKRKGGKKNKGKKKGKAKGKAKEKAAKPRKEKPHLGKPLWDSAFDGKLREVERLIDDGAPLNWRDP